MVTHYTTTKEDIYASALKLYKDSCSINPVELSDGHKEIIDNTFESCLAHLIHMLDMKKVAQQPIDPLCRYLCLRITRAMHVLID